MFLLKYAAPAIAVVFFWSSCDSKPELPEGRGRAERYYLGFKGGQFPFVPAHEVDEESATEHDTYYVGKFDQGGKLVRFIKVSAGGQGFECVYRYDHQLVLAEAVLFDESGKEVHRIAY